ncbi:MAG TPA: substrate-binding domain-containing protein [Usitatibacter sp.]|nr:substrate-binding domain-containing protein [Usitatibacter sp.]
MERHRLRHAIMALALALSCGAASADEIVVFSTPTLKGVIEDLRPAFEKESGHRVVPVYAAAAALERRIESGEAFDLAILLEPQFAALARSGRTAQSAKLARAVAGVAVRSGAGEPRDFGTQAALRKAIVDARVLAFAKDSASGAYFASLFDRLGVPGEKRKLKAFPDPVAAVAAGEADFTVISIPNILGRPGIALGGTLPDSLQNVTVFWIAPNAQASHGAATSQLVSALRSARASYARHGLEPLSP